MAYISSAYSCRFFTMKNCKILIVLAISTCSYNVFLSMCLYAGSTIVEKVYHNDTILTLQNSTPNVCNKRMPFIHHLPFFML